MPPFYEHGGRDAHPRQEFRFIATRTILAQDRKFALAEADSAFLFSFALKTRLFSGWAKVVAPSGKTVTANVAGVLLPSWDESGETVAKPFVIELVK